jgi:hypothetical protein
MFKTRTYRFFALLFAVELVSCKLVAPIKAPRRLGSKDNGIVIQDSISLERANDGTSIILSFDTREAASCKLGFFVPASGQRSSETPNPCANSSATKFSETITGLPKDQLVTIILRIWPAKLSETSATVMTLPEALPSAGANAVNMVFVDMGAARMDLVSVASSAQPSELVAKSISSNGQQCALSDANTQVNPMTKGALVLQSATSRGFIHTTTSRVSPNALGGTFSSVQRQSSEWNITARSTEGFGRIRLARPTLMASSIFSGREQAEANDDSLEDIDPPAIKVSGGSTMVASWTLAGDAKNSVATLTIAPMGTFPGITCTAPAASMKITVPSDLVAKIPANSRLWGTIRIDSWQAMDRERWAVRVSDWKSMGVQRL